MNPGAVLVIFLIVYALLGAAFAFNIWGLSDRAAQAYRGKPWLVRQIGRDNPNVWRGGGLIMFAFGVAMVAGILLLAIWNPPTISTAAALGLLAVATVASVLMLVSRRHAWKPSATNHPPEPPEGR